MAELSFEEQDLTIDKLINKYLGGHKGCGNILEINHPVFNMVTFVHPTIDWDVYSPNAYEDKAAIEFDIDGLGVFIKEYTIQELQQKYFQDILTPTKNELIMFELSEGFEWPLAAVQLSEQSSPIG